MRTIFFEAFAWKLFIASEKFILALCNKNRNNRLFFFPLLITGVCKTEEDEGPTTEEDSQSFHGLGVCKWFNVRMGFGFLSMTSREGVPLEAPVDVFVHQVS